MGKKKDAEAPAEAAPAKKVTQREAVTQALNAGNELPPDGVKFVKDTFGMELSNQSFSTLKSQIKKAAGESKPKAKPGRPAGAKAAPAQKPSANGVPNMATQIEAIKSLVDTLGADQVVSIARLFAK